jgi:hypothetical protein
MIMMLPLKRYLELEYTSQMFKSHKIDYFQHKKPRVIHYNLTYIK